MKASRSCVLLLWAILLLLASYVSVPAQTPGAGTEFWPKLSATLELWPQTRVQVWGERQDGEDFDFQQWKVGALVSYRMKRMVNLRHHDIDEENEHNLVLAGGYEYLQTNQNNQIKREHRIILQSTPKYIFGAGVLVQDRNRIEFRWNAGTYDFRYRNKLTVQRAFAAKKFHFTPYAAGELLWDRNHHSWNQNQYAFGVQLPFRRRLMLDTYYLRQNCTTCSEDPLNVVGVTLNLYFKKKKK